MPGKKFGGPRRSKHKPRSEELARAAIAHEESMPGDKVRMTFRVVLGRPQAETLAARAIREQKNIVSVVEDILQAAAGTGPW